MTILIIVLIIVISVVVLGAAIGLIIVATKKKSNPTSRPLSTTIKPTSQTTSRTTSSIGPTSQTTSPQTTIYSTTSFPTTIGPLPPNNFVGMLADPNTSVYSYGAIVAPDTFYLQIYGWAYETPDQMKRMSNNNFAFFMGFYNVTLTVDPDQTFAEGNKIVFSTTVGGFLCNIEQQGNQYQFIISFLNNSVRYYLQAGDPSNYEQKMTTIKNNAKVYQFRKSRDESTFWTVNELLTNVPPTLGDTFVAPKCRCS